MFASQGSATTNPKTQMYVNKMHIKPNKKKKGQLIEPECIHKFAKLKRKQNIKYLRAALKFCRKTSKPCARGNSECSVRDSVSEPFETISIIIIIMNEHCTGHDPKFGYTNIYVNFSL